MSTPRRLKSPGKTMTGNLQMDTQMRMHAKAHLLQMKNTKLMKEQKKLGKERANLDKELQRVGKKMAELYEEESALSNKIQRTVCLETEKELYDEETKYNEFLKRTLEILENSAKEPIKKVDANTEEELAELLQELETENERIISSHATLEKTAHVDRYNKLVEEMAEQAIKHEADASEAEQKASEHQLNNQKGLIILQILDDRLERAKDRKEKAINTLTMSDNKKKNAIVRLEEAKARKEEADNQNQLLTQKEAEQTQKENDFYGESKESFEEEEEDPSNLKDIIRSPQYQRYSQLTPKRAHDQMDSVVVKYEKVLTSQRRQDKNRKLFNDHINLYREEEYTRWNDHWQNQMKMAEDEIQSLQGIKTADELQQEIDRAVKQTDDLSTKDAKLRQELEEFEHTEMPNLKEETTQERVIRIPDYEREIDNIEREYEYLSVRKAALTREIARQESLKDIAFSALDFQKAIQPQNEENNETESQ